jgi:hypothetical protein
MLGVLALDLVAPIQLETAAVGINGTSGVIQGENANGVTTEATDKDSSDNFNGVMVNGVKWRGQALCKLLNSSSWRNPHSPDAFLVPAKTPRE